MAMGGGLMENIARVRTEQEAQRLTKRETPIDLVNITATTLGTAQTVYTIRSDAAFKVKRMTLANTSVSDVTFSLFIVPPSGSAATSNAIFYQVLVLANSTSDLTDFIGGFYRKGYRFMAFAGSSGVLNIGGWGEEVF